MQERLRREIYRKALHITGITVPIVYLIFGRDPALLYTSIALLIFLTLEFIRIRANRLFPLERTAEYIQRKGEKNSLAAPVYFCVAAIVSIFFFSESAVIVGLTAALLSDTAAALVGTGIGRRQIRKNKTLEGSIAGVVVAMAIGLVFNAGFAVMFALGVAFLIFDLVDLGIDDNLTTPLAMVAVVQILEVLL
jgi:dolichol kinase